jgi:hypothetical protein
MRSRYINNPWKKERREEERGCHCCCIPHLNDQGAAFGVLEPISMHTSVPTTFSIATRPDS